MLQISDFRLFSAKTIVFAISDMVWEQSDFIYITGANASGKTLFLKTLSGQYKDFVGSITFKKQALKEHLKRNNILMISSELPVLTDKTFLENIQLPFGHFTQKQKGRLLEMISIFDLVDQLNTKMLYSSQSQRMMMYLIRASLISPGLLLIDDLDSYLDQINISNALKVIQYCTKSGMLVIATGKTLIDTPTTYLIQANELQLLPPRTPTDDNQMREAIL